MSFSKANPGSYEQIRQIHNRGIAIEGKLYYGLAKVAEKASGTPTVVKIYRGTHDGRLKEETNLTTAEQNIISNDTDINNNKIEINKNAKNIEVLDKTKADKCFAIAMSIVLG